MCFFPGNYWIQSGVNVGFFFHTVKMTQSTFAFSAAHVAQLPPTVFGPCLLVSHKGGHVMFSNSNWEFISLENTTPTPPWLGEHDPPPPNVWRREFAEGRRTKCFCTSACCHSSSCHPPTQMAARPWRWQWALFQSFPADTSVLCQHKGRAPQPSITFSCQARGGGSSSWGSSTPSQWQWWCRRDSIRPIRVALGLKIRERAIWHNSRHQKCEKKTSRLDSLNTSSWQKCCSARKRQVPNDCSNKAQNTLSACWEFCWINLRCHGVLDVEETLGQEVFQISPHSDGQNTSRRVFGSLSEFLVALKIGLRTRTLPQWTVRVSSALESGKWAPKTMCFDQENGQQFVNQKVCIIEQGADDGSLQCSGVCRVSSSRRGQKSRNFWQKVGTFSATKGKFRGHKVYK